jgi:hypothetical protein
MLRKGLLRRFEFDFRARNVWKGVDLKISSGMGWFGFSSEVPAPFSGEV